MSVNGIERIRPTRLDVTCMDDKDRHILEYMTEETVIEWNPLQQPKGMSTALAREPRYSWPRDVAWVWLSTFFRVLCGGSHLR